jgi:hypothetical protein
MNTLKEKLSTTETELQTAIAGGDKDGQVKRLREERDKAQNEFKTYTEKVSKDIEAIRLSVTGDYKGELLDKLSGTDPEMKKKIEFFYDSFKGDAVSKKDIKSRVENAYILAAGKTPAPGFLDGITGGGARGGQDYNPGGSKKAPTENEIAIGNVLGVTDKDREKFRGKVNSSSKE